MEGIVWATEASGMSAKLVSLMLEMAMGYGAARLIGPGRMGCI